MDHSGSLITSMATMRSLLGLDSTAWATGITTFLMSGGPLGGVGGDGLKPDDGEAAVGVVSVEVVEKRTG